MTDDGFLDEQPVGKTLTGIISRYFGERGFGYIKEDNNGHDHWFHRTNFKGKGDISLYMKVSFKVGAGRQPGKLQAIEVEPLESNFKEPEEL